MRVSRLHALMQGRGKLHDRNALPNIPRADAGLFRKDRYRVALVFCRKSGERFRFFLLGDVFALEVLDHSRNECLLFSKMTDDCLDRGGFARPVCELFYRPKPSFPGHDFELGVLVLDRSYDDRLQKAHRLDGLRKFVNFVLIEDFADICR